MQSINYIQEKLSVFVVLGLSFLFASCGSYQYVGYDNDGIYGEEEVVYEENQSTPSERNETQSVYKDYFTEKELQYGDIPVDDNAIFTDIDSYSSSYDEQAVADGNPSGQAGWGSANDNITINFIDNGWNNWGWNAGFGYGWNNWGWGWNRPWGWNNWGWNAGFGWGWNNWGWNAGFGFNGWCPPGYFYGNGFIRNNNLAYHYGRRGINLNRNSLSRRNYSNLSRRNSTSYRNRSTIRTRDARSRNIRSRSNRSSIRPRTSSTIRSNRSTIRPRTSTSTRSRNNSVRSRNSSVRSRNSSSSSNRSRVSTSRGRSSSSSVRSSGGSSRSSGSRGRSSGGRRR